MQKKIFKLLLLLFLTSCGYEAMHSKKNTINYNFSISEINFNGDREINQKIKAKLNNYTLDKKDKNFILKISSNSKKITLSKDIQGNATNFQKIIVMSVEVLINDKFKNSFIIMENFNYNNNPNKFDLRKYEKEIKNNLTETAVDKLIFKLSNIQ
jgi:outer membrane lipopolysaccharide assembly protein LptE/RlpB